MLKNNDSNRWNCKEQFQQWFEDHCKDCWGNGYGDCEKCKQLKANIEAKYNKKKEMQLGKAIAISKNIQSPDYTDKEKANAIYLMMNMVSHMSITKYELIDVIKWLWHYSWEFVTEDDEMVGEENDT